MRRTKRERKKERERAGGQELEGVREGDFPHRLGTWRADITLLSTRWSTDSVRKRDFNLRPSSCESRALPLSYPCRHVNMMFFMASLYKNTDRKTAMSRMYV
jgi:hypothetical protein